MQATQTFKVGDRVRVNTTKYGDDQFGDVGIVVERKSHRWLLPVRVEFEQPAHLPSNSYEDSELVVAPKLQPSAADDLRLTPQAKIVLSHLKKRQRISPAEALTVYGISRLASCIHEIRNRAGYTVRTEQRRDDHGHKYAKYILA